MVPVLEVHPGGWSVPREPCPLRVPSPCSRPCCVSLGSQHIVPAPGPFVPSYARESPPGASEAPARASSANPEEASTHAPRAQQHAPAKPGSQRSLDHFSQKLNATTHWLSSDLSAEADVDQRHHPRLGNSSAHWTRIAGGTGTSRNAQSRPRGAHYWASVSLL